MAPAFENAMAVSGFTSTTHQDTYPFVAPEKLDLSGRSVFITGASKGIGRATAISFARAGASKIAIGARSDLSSLERELRQAAAGAGRAQAPQVVSLVLDVTSEDSVRAAADTVAREFGGALDVLVNNAGYLENWVNTTETDPADWWAGFEVNVKGLYLCNRYLIPLLLRGDLKTDVLTSSVGGLMVKPGASGYQSAKFAVCRLAEFIAAEYQGEGLVCFAIHPAGPATELATKMPKDMHSSLVDTPELPGDTVAWLSKESRPWLSGRYLSVKWDMEELEARKDEIVERDLFKFRMVI